MGLYSGTIESETIEISKRLNDPSNVVYRAGGAVVYPDVTADGIFGELVSAVYDFALRTLCYWKQNTNNVSASDDTTITTVAGTGSYNLPTDLYEIERMTWKGKRVWPIDTIRAAELDYNYLVTQGDPMYYLMDFDGPGTFRLMPIPSSAQAVLIEYYARPKVDIVAHAGGKSPDYSVSPIRDIAQNWIKFIRFKTMAESMRNLGPGQDLKGAAYYDKRYQYGVDLVNRRRERAARFRIFRMGGDKRRRPGPARPIWPAEFGD